MMDFVRSLRLEEKLSPRKNSEIIWFYIFFPALIGYLILLTDFINSKPSIGSVEILDGSFKSLIYPDKRMEIITEGLSWTEGPLWIQDDAASLSYLMFSDTILNRIYKWEEGKGMFTVGRTIYVEESGCRNDPSHCTSMYEPGSNGLIRKAYDAMGVKDSSLDLVVCQHGERAVAVLSEGGTRTALVTHYKGQRLNSPNDLIWSAEGHLYFTDPTYGLVDAQERGRIVGQELAHSGVYLVRRELVQMAMAAGQPTEHAHLLDATMTRPNGLAFSPDFSKLYVSNSDLHDPYWKVFDVADSGVLTNGRIFFNASQLMHEDVQRCQELQRQQRQQLELELRQCGDNSTTSAGSCSAGDRDFLAAAAAEVPECLGGVVGAPDGLKVDIHGNLFASGPGGVLVLSPEGKLIGRLRMEDRPVSNVAFGGDGRLYLTARDIVARLWVRTRPNRALSSKL